ncbi:nuclease PIN [Klebsiella aerogenes]|nr:nuclease PIN [Klebsiella aerogenes]ELY3087349.1 nuclease PIN [Klebsiella aerogenes]
MKKTTAGICLAAMLISCGMNCQLLADELLPRDEHFMADETRHQWVNERDGRTGVLMVSGSLLSSPCTLETNDISLPLPEETSGGQARYAMTLRLTGCGEGGRVITVSSQVGRNSIQVTRSALLIGVKDGILQAEQHLLGKGKAVFYGGANQMTYYLNKAQHQAITKSQVLAHVQKKAYMNSGDSNSLLRLQLDYE